MNQYYTEKNNMYIYHQTIHVFFLLIMHYLRTYKVATNMIHFYRYLTHLTSDSFANTKK